ncbi:MULTISPECIES: hypothetical protein [unclassified Streptomyces]|jgi:hypothetical protein|uniref:hypothetical protein n=1 Tax=unclassified Streptomyces TaxID=2593676 RepID=UPI0036B3D732
MRNATPLRRALPALLATTLLAGGLLVGQTAAAGPASAAKTVTCDITKLRTEARKERDRAAQLRRLGAPAEARKALARAESLERRARQCRDAEENNRPPLWK